MTLKAPAYPIGIAALALGIFFVDIALPLGVSVGVLYAIPVMMTQWAPQRKAIVATATASTILIFLDYFISPPGGIVWMVLTNRALSVATVWMVAYLCFLRRRAEEDRNRVMAQLQESLQHVQTLRGLLPVCASCKKIRDTRGYWNRVDEYIERYSEARVYFGMCPECVEAYNQERTGERTTRKNGD
jgi:hypothetical protein